jgi:hypothetical protein
MVRNYRLILSGVLAVVLLSAIAAASSPNNQITALLTTNVINGKIAVGEILFIPLQYVPEIRSLNNFSAITTQRYDRLLWLGGESISVNDPLNQETIVLPGGQYYFSRVGNHIITSLSNASKTAVITITNEPPNSITMVVNQVPRGFVLNFSQSSFVITGAEKVINATLFVDDDVVPGKYKVNYSINDNSYVKEFVVVKNVNWSIKDVSFSLNQTIKSGENRYLGTISIQNTGNQDVSIELTKAGEKNNVVVVQAPRTLFKKTTIDFDIQLQVPSITPTGVYDIIIVAMDEFDKRDNITLRVNVIDAIPPRIDEINFSTDKAFMPNEVRVIAVDNNNVSNVTMEYDGKKVRLLKDQNLFTTQVTFNKISEYAIKFCASDDSTNVYCTTINKTFTKVSALDGGVRTIRMPTMRYAKYSRVFLINLTENIPEGVVVELVSMEAVGGGNVSYTLRIVDDKGGVKRFDAFDNQIMIKEKGRYYLEVRSEEAKDYEGLLRYNVPEYVDEISDLSFFVSFKDYDIPQDFTINWFGKDVSCKVVDTGDLDTSYRECPIVIPIDIAQKDIALPTTIREREQLDSQVGVVEDELSRTKKRTAVIITLLSVLILLIIVFIYYIVNIYPYFRILRSVKTND